MTLTTKPHATNRVYTIWHQVKKAILWILRSKQATIGIIIMGIALAVAVIGPSIAPHPYQEINLSKRVLPTFWMEGGSWQYPLGTDDLGRCILSRIIYSIRISLIVGGTVTILAIAVGVTLGLIAGYFGGIAEVIIMRLVDVQWSFPSLLLAIAVMSLLGTTFINLLLVLVITSWVHYARVIRSEVLSLREMEFIVAIRTLGAKPIYIIYHHILRNVTAPILVLATFSMASIIIMESSLSFIGLGVQPPIPSLGGMISGSRNYLYSAWWIVTFPGIALALLVLGVNQLGDGLRDLLDPRLRGVL